MSQSDRDLLSRWRQIGARHSAEVVDIAPRVLQAGVKGEEEWAVREQLAFAALDMGMIDWATDQIRALERHFPGSPRVAILSGMRAEAMGSREEARAMYESILVKDETNTSAHQRLISLSLPLGPSHSIPLLLTYLDTYYTDASAWSLLADLYCEAGLYSQGLTALGHVMVVQGWDTAAVSRAGGVAYTMGDYQLSLKYYLRAIEMSTPPKPTSSQTPSSTRDWWGVRQCTNRLLDDTSAPTSLPPDLIIPQEKLRLLQALAIERILSAGGENMGIRRKVLGEQSIVR